MSPSLPYIHIPNYHFGPIGVQIFGLFVAFAVLIGAMLAKKRAKDQNLDPLVMTDSLVWVIPGGFLLSHVASVVLYFPERIARNPWSLLYVWEGISSFGGLLGGLLVAWCYFRIKRIPMLPYLDALAYGLIAGFLVGRMGCAIAHDHPGMALPTQLRTGMEIATYELRHGAQMVTQMVSFPGWSSPWFWLTLVAFMLTAGLLASLLVERPLFHRIPLATMGGMGLLFLLLSPMFPAFVRGLGIPFPAFCSNSWEPLAKATYFSLQDLEPGLERWVLSEMPVLFGPYFDRISLHSFFFADVAYEVTVPARLVWGNFSYVATLIPPHFQKTYHIQTQMAYDLGLLELFYYIGFFVILTALLQYKPRRDGFVLACWLLSFAPVRFALDFLRIADKTYAGFTPGHGLAMLSLTLGIFFYFQSLQTKTGTSLQHNGS